MRNIFSWIFKNTPDPSVDIDARRLNQRLIDSVSTRTELTRTLVPELTQNRYKKHTFDLASVLSEMAVVERDND